ncbi:LOW QUALITY PROTEIN: epididymal-specific lipocalin-12 [Peromyscus californicus insignis]|uniref:LOW QUALITY PROTEIN: epididymal-specific lipocalin-12 n=1 Tax=Peromyscus californicus insignis TaxID=564181 RepID=UPI0022A7B7A2|nr:LOW QUALITY PROTEIN: epididymal-specific lipocalin-12 [Peromyscus californicus insignis]
MSFWSLVAAGMGPWWALWLILILPQIPEGQTPAKPQGFPQLTSFENDKFQGEWFVHGLAGNAYKREHRDLLNPYIALFELKDNSHFRVTNTMTRGKRCDTWSYTLIPATKPGEFTMENKGKCGIGWEDQSHLGNLMCMSLWVRDWTDREDVQVIETDYTHFALVLSLRTTSSQTITRVSLLGRNWRLPHKTIDRFICLTRTQNLTKNNFIFPDVTGNGFASRA